jgi:AraC family transcriptional regulator of arabinose operon
MKALRHFFAQWPINSPELQVRAIGTQETMRPGIINRPAGTGDYLFMFFYDPTLIMVEGTVRYYPPRTMMIWDAEHGHYYGNPETPWTHSWLHADGAWLREAVQQSGLACNIPFTLSDPTIVDQYLLTMYREVTEYPTPIERIVRNVLHNWLLELARQRHGAPAGIPQPFLQLKGYIGAHLQQRLTLTELAQQLHLSVPYFCGQFKRYFGISAGEYLIRSRLQHAVYLLHDANVPIAQVAQLSGYHDTFHFSKQFKQYYRISPRAFRQRLFTREMGEPGTELR